MVPFQYAEYAFAWQSGWEGTPNERSVLEASAGYIAY